LEINFHITQNPSFRRRKSANLLTHDYLLDKSTTLAA
jgi:hypothetical protein